MIATTKIKAIIKVLYTSLIAAPIYVALLKAISKFKPSGKFFFTSFTFLFISFESSTVDAPLLA